MWPSVWTLTSPLAIFISLLFEGITARTCSILVPNLLSNSLSTFLIELVTKDASIIKPFLTPREIEVAVAKTLNFSLYSLGN